VFSLALIAPPRSHGQPRADAVPETPSFPSTQDRHCDPRHRAHSLRDSLPWATFIVGICVYLAAIPFVIVKLNGELAAQRAKP
jgi:hypothetical protein